MLFYIFILVHEKDMYFQNQKREQTKQDMSWRSVIT